MDILPHSHSPATKTTQTTLVKRQKRWATKVRSGCLTCRSRRVKCDETKPECQRCARVGRDCTGAGYSSSPSAKSASTCTAGYMTSNSTSPVHTQQTSPRLLVPVHSPSQVLSLDGSAAVRDLIYLLPQIPSYVARSSVSAPESSLSEYILFRGEQLALFLAYIPPRLAYSNALNSSINCVSSALHDLLVPPECRSPIKTFTLYAQALTALQTAIDDPTDSLSSETLCSTQLLSIFEFLARRGAKTSASHTQGMVQMVKLRGPSSFTTEFDRALLISQVPFISANAVFRAQPCFLEDKRWKSAIHAAIMSRPTNIDRSELRISMLDFTIPYPRLVGAAHRIIMHPRPETLLAQRQSVINDVYMCRRCVKSWLQRHKHMLHPPATQQQFTELGVGDSLSTRTAYAVMQIFLHILYNRLHVALGGPEALLLEQTTRDVAISVLGDAYVQQIAPSSSNIRLTFEAASAVLTTTGEWQEYIKSNHELVTPRMWQTWLTMTEIRPE